MPEDILVLPLLVARDDISVTKIIAAARSLQAGNVFGVDGVPMAFRNSINSACISVLSRIAAVAFCNRKGGGARTGTKVLFWSVGLRLGVASACVRLLATNTLPTEQLISSRASYIAACYASPSRRGITCILAASRLLWQLCGSARSRCFQEDDSIGALFMINHDKPRRCRS